MLSVDWVSSTPEGARLGQLACAQAQLHWSPFPWWTFVWEPMRWFFILTSATPHSFYTALIYLVASLVGAWAVQRRCSLRAGVVTALCTMMVLLGGCQFTFHLSALIPHGYRWSVPEGAGFRLANLHAHSQASGGALMPEDVLRWHLAAGYSVVGITDSNKIYGAKRAQEAATRLHLPVVVVPGEEYRGTTHLIMLNLSQPIRADQVALGPAIALARSLGAYVIEAHPWTSQETPEHLHALGVQGFEVSSVFTHAPASVAAFCAEHKLAELGGLDFRAGAEPLVATVLPGDADTPARVQQALERGDCAAIFCPEIEEKPEFSYWTRVAKYIPELWESGGRLLLPGVLFWLGVLTLVSRRPRLSQPNPTVLVGWILGLGTVTGLVAVWSVWWKFKQLWFPSLELSYTLWALCCPICLYLWGELCRVDRKQASPTTI